MRTHYKSQKQHNLTYLLKLWVVNVLVTVGGFALANYLFQIFSNQSTLLAVFVFAAISSWLHIGQKDRINDITIDTMNREIFYSYYAINEGQVERSFSFDEARIKISKSDIYFFVDKKHTFSISKEKDGFSTYTLNQIKESLEGLTSPVKA